jgi:2-dehydro-3-deoxyglucarate aldolase
MRRTTGAFRAYTSAAAPRGGGGGGGGAEGYALGPNEHSLASGALKAKIRSGDAVTGVLTNMWGDTNHVEMLGMMGAFDFLWVEAEHGTPSPSDCEKLYLAAERRALPTVTRIGYGEHLEPGLMQKYLVGGSGGIILPQCDSALDVRRVVDGVKFPPLGKRGLAGDRWNAWGMGVPGGSMADRVAASNANSVVGVMIESREFRGRPACAPSAATATAQHTHPPPLLRPAVDAAERLDEILAEPNLDFVSLGPTDISASMGRHGDIYHPEVVAKVEELGARIMDSGVATGTLILNMEDWRFWRARGFQVMCCVAATFFADGAGAMAGGIKTELQAEQAARAAGSGADAALRVAEARAARAARLGVGTKA